MLTCVYHPVNGMVVVEDDEAEHLKATGVWFDSPGKAKEYREKVEEEIKAEIKPTIKGKKNERKSNG